MTLDRRCLFACLMLLLAIGAFAQDPGDYLDDDEAENPATLFLTFDNQGTVKVRLNLPKTDSDPDPLANALGNILHCPAGALQHPDVSSYFFPDWMKNWPASKRERYRKQMIEFNRRQFSGICSGVLARHEQVLEGDFDYASALPQLRDLGVDELYISITLPKAQFRDFTRANLSRDPVGNSRNLIYVIPLAEGSKQAAFHLAFGFRQADVNGAFKILAGFILLPILVTLWMRHRALALAQIDAAGAWFGFSRTLNWLLLGITLFWITSGLGARQTLQDWIGTFGLALWKQAVADVAIILLPTFLTYFFCLAISYPVHAQLRGSQWTRREFLVRQAVTLGATVLPMILLLSAVGLLRDEPEISIWLFFSTVLVFQALHVLRVRITRELPHPLSTGELRDRIFALASRLGVSVKQIFILPAGKGQVANAYAAKNSIVMFTDYLLEHLSKREVDAIAAHELAHLRHKHPAKRIAAFLAALFLPYYFFAVTRALTSLVISPVALSMQASGTHILAHLYRGLNVFEQWSQKDFVLLLVGMTAFYFLSRHHENVADATAVRLTGDAEAQITGLLKVNRLNLMPIRWGKASESWLTHPSTVRRVQSIATVGGLAPERLEAILDEYDSQPNPAKVIPAEDRYEIPSVSDPEKIRAALQQRTRAQGKFWLHLISYVVPPVLTGLLIREANLVGFSFVVVYLAGFILGSCFITLLGVWLGEADRAREKNRLVASFAREHLPLGNVVDYVVGFAPGPYPRIYGRRYHWDTGFLILSKDRLQFMGEQTRFSFSAAEIDDIVLGPGGPSWWKFERIYVRWKTDAEHNGIFNVNSLEPGPFWRSRRRVRDLYERLQHWHVNSYQYSEVRQELASLPRLEFKQVTSISPESIGKWNLNVRLLALLLPITVGIAILAHADIWYLCTSVFILRLIQMVPYWRYRDVLPAFSQPSSAVSKFQVKEAPASVGANS